MRKALWVIVVLSLAGCSSDDGGKPEPCDFAHRRGTFTQHSVERAGGTCGATTDQVVRADDPAGLPPDCAKDADDKLSADQCSYSRSYTCAIDGGGTASAVAVIIEHDGGAKLTGTISITIHDADGAFACSSAYDVELIRQ